MKSETRLAFRTPDSALVAADGGVPQASSLHGQRHERAGKMPAVQARVVLVRESFLAPPGAGHPNGMQDTKR